MDRASGFLAILTPAVLALLCACQFDTSGTPYVTGDAPTGPDGPAPGPGDAPPDGQDGPQGTGPTDCPSGFVTVAGAPVTSKYYVADDKEDWSSARYLCFEMAEAGAIARTHLLALETPAEYQALISSYDADSQQLGLSRLPLAGSWSWVTGTTADPANLPWEEGEPSSGKHCAAVVFVDGPQGNGDVARLRAVNCVGSTQRKYICECEDGVGDSLFE